MRTMNKIMGMGMRMTNKKIETLCSMTKQKVTIKRIMMIKKPSLSLVLIMMISLKK